MSPFLIAHAADVLHVHDYTVAALLGVLLLAGWLAHIRWTRRRAIRHAADRPPADPRGR